jgi:hypothetical protein
MSGASRALDPIEAAEAGIAGSKNLMAAVADELSQQQRWLAHYQVAEKRHARRVKFQELTYWLELRRRRLVRWSSRLALTSLRGARAGAAFLWRTAVTLVVMLRRVTTACVTWIRPRAYALALGIRRWLTAFWSWTVATSRMLARALLKAASLGLAWLAMQSRALAITLQRWVSVAWTWTRINAAILARASLKHASIASSWIAATSLALAIVLWRWLIRTWNRTRVQTRILSRASLKGAQSASLWIGATSRAANGTLKRNLSAGAAWTGATAGASARISVAAASAGYSWAALNMRAMSHGMRRTKPQADTDHRGLVVRRCTALVCLEPRRARLPAIRAG